MLGKGISLQTSVERFALKRCIGCGDGSVFLGSCFADSIGERFADYGLASLSNPLGTLYNPASIREVILPLSDISSAALPLFEREGEWRCWLAGTQVAAPTEEECRGLIVSSLERLREQLCRARHLFVTLGTSVCYRLRQSGLTVCNCHKAAASLFEEHRLSVDECVAALSDIVRNVTALNPDIEVVFTVSPFRYQKYGFHGSQLSKATLLLSLEEVGRLFPERCSYLPVYELFMDELRDYRFYASDMLHPSPLAVDIVWNRLVEECMTPPLQRYLEEYEPIRRALAHRPLNPDTPEYQSFLSDTERKRAALVARYQTET